MQLETERLILREFKATDWKAVHEYAIDPDVVKFMVWGPNTVEQSHAFIDMVLEKQRQKPRTAFELAVTLKDGGTLIGACGIRLVPGNDLCADIGYCYNKKYWGRGYASEAAAKLMDFGFEQLHLHRIYATCDADNIGSLSVMKKCGMRQEAHFRQDMLIKGHWRDSYLCAILRDEWDAQKQSV